MSRRRPMRKLPATVRVPKNYVLRAGVVLVVVVLATVGRQRGAPTQRPVTEDDYERYHGRSFTVVKVVDGDTIDIDIPDVVYDTTRIRLWSLCYLLPIHLTCLVAQLIRSSANKAFNSFPTSTRELQRCIEFCAAREPL